MSGHRRFSELAAEVRSDLERSVRVDAIKREIQNECICPRLAAADCPLHGGPAAREQAAGGHS
jgi:hypothetical protein